MKKIIYSALLLVGLLAVAQKSEARDIFDEGVQTSTITLSTTTAFIRGPVIITGVGISSTSLADAPLLPYVSFASVDPSTFTNLFTSTSGASELFRVYATTNNSVGVTGREVEFVYPRYFPRGAVVSVRKNPDGATTNTFNLISIYHYKPRAQGQEE